MRTSVSASLSYSNLMRLWIQIVAFAISALSIAGCGNANRGTANGDKEVILVPDTTFHNLGKIAYGDIILISNSIQNSSSEDITITEISTDCSCLTAIAESMEVPSGSSTKLRMELDTHGNVGKQYHLTTLKTDKGQTLKICIFADIEN